LTHEQNALALTVAGRDGKPGPNLKPSTVECDKVGTTVAFAAVTNSPGARCGIQPSPTGGPGRILAFGLEMSALAALLAPSQRQPVVDQTGLTGRYDVDMTYTPEVDVVVVDRIEPLIPD
jgi:uncharacterized protein (TIGR03435 family)